MDFHFRCQEGVSIFYGIDLHIESFKVASLAKDSEDMQIKTVSLKTNAFANFLSTLTDEDYVVVEASTNIFWFVDQVKDRVTDLFFTHNAS